MQDQVGVRSTRHKISYIIKKFDRSEAAALFCKLIPSIINSKSMVSLMNGLKICCIFEFGDCLNSSKIFSISLEIRIHNLSHNLKALAYQFPEYSTLRGINPRHSAAKPV